MATTLMDRAYFTHLCGYYDHKNPPRVLPQATGTLSLESIEAHEKAHKFLAEHSVYGIWLIVLCENISLTEGGETSNALNQTAALLAANSVEVQEGFASYIEFYTGSTQSNSIAKFQYHLAKLPSFYLAGFKSAQKIDAIISDKTIPELTEEQINYLKRCLLIDICRFAMNVPISEEQLFLLKDVKDEILLPNYRFNYVMEKLSSDCLVRSEFIKKAIPIMKICLNKYENSTGESNIYSGVTYLDHCEHIIAELFPDIPYIRPEKFDDIKKYVAFKSGQHDSENLEDYLVRANPSELEFFPLQPIHYHSDKRIDDLINKLLIHLADSSQGCYIRFYPHPKGAMRNILLDDRNRSTEINIPIGQSLAFVHFATITQNETNGRIWNYDGWGDAYLLDKIDYGKILSVLQNREAAVVFDAPLDFYDPFEPIEWAKLGNHVYLVPTPTGSISSLKKILCNDRLKEEGAEIVVMTNWTHFEHSGNNQILLLWLIPRSVEFAASILYVGTNQLHDYLVIAVERNWLPEGFNIVKNHNGGHNGVNGVLGRVQWQIGTSDEKILAPGLSDVVSSHLLFFGW